MDNVVAEGDDQWCGENLIIYQIVCTGGDDCKNADHSIDFFQCVILQVALMFGLSQVGQS